MADLIQETQKRLRSQGGRMTAQRRLILEALQNMGGHPTADDLYIVVSKIDKNIHISTVYRTLRWLEQEGLVKARFFGDERFERFDPALPIEHYHFVCTVCKQIYEFDSLLVKAIKTQFETHSGAQIESGSVVLYGICANCLEQKGTSNGKK